MPEPLKQTNNIKFLFLKKLAMFTTDVAIFNKSDYEPLRYKSIFHFL